MNDPLRMQALLAWMSVPGVGDRTLAELLAAARESRVSLDAFWRAPLEDLVRLVRLNRAAQEALEQRRDSLWSGAESLAALAREHGVEAFTSEDPTYPQRLGPGIVARGARRWPVLFAAGALALLEQPLVALVNSRAVSTAGVEWTDRLADALARRDIGLITGVNREAYQAAAVAAKRHGGAVVLVFDRDLSTATRGGLDREPVAAARVWDEALDPETQLLVSPFGPCAGWTPRSGRRRDALLLDLASAVVAIEITYGGYMDRECRRCAESGKPVFAVDRDAATPPGTRRLWDEMPAVRRLPGTLPGATDDLAAAIAAVLRPPAVHPEDRSAGWARDVREFLVAGLRALTHDQWPGSVAVLPVHGELATLVARTPLAGPAERGRGTGIVEAVIGLFPSLGSLRVAAERLAPDGVLVGTLASAALSDATGGTDREALIGAGSLRAIVELPASPGADSRSDAVIVYIRCKSTAEARMLRIGQSADTGPARRRYLTGALALLSTLEPRDRA